MTTGPQTNKSSTLRKARIEVAEQEEREALGELKDSAIGYAYPCAREVACTTCVEYHDCVLQVAVRESSPVRPHCCGPQRPVDGSAHAYPVDAH